MMAATDSPDIRLATLRNEPTDNALPKLPIDPIENADPLDPIDMTESVEAMDSRLREDRTLHRDVVSPDIVLLPLVRQG